MPESPELTAFDRIIWNALILRNAPKSPEPPKLSAFDQMIWNRLILQESPES